MSNLLKRQKFQIATIIRKYNLEPTDFDWIPQPNGIFADGHSTAEIFHIKSGYYFKIEPHEKKGFYVAHTPNEESAMEKIYLFPSWNAVLGHFDEWTRLIREEMSAEDPWEQPGDNGTFSEEDTVFTAAELPVVDKAIDVAFATLLEKAAEGKIIKKLEDIQKDVKYLKDQARKLTRTKWLDLFKQVIAAKALDWGLGQEVVVDVLRSLYDAAMPVLTIVAKTL